MVHVCVNLFQECESFVVVDVLLLIFWYEGAYPVFKLVTWPAFTYTKQGNPFKKQAKRVENWSNSLKVVQPPGQLESWLNKQPMTQTT